MKIIKKLSLIVLTFIISFAGINKLHASSASISISSSTSKVVVGNTFTVTIKISSSSSLGSWEFTPSYDSSMLNLISGETPIVESADNGSTKSKSYTYKFKSLKTGNTTISVKSYGAYSWDEEKLSVSAGSKSISIITQAQLEASYSKNNDLKSLSIEGLELTPEFDDDITEYKAEAEANTTNIEIKAKAEDSKSSISGTGSKEVSEGENKFNITVTAENGSIKTYIIIVNVIDPNPIKVTVNDIEYTLVKRESLLECPENFEKIELTIDEQTVPAYYNKLNDFIVVGLKDNEGNVKYFLYDKENKTYTEYSEITLNQLKIFPLKIDKEFDDIYEKSQTTINGSTFESLKIKNSEYSIIHARNILTGENNYYLYDSILNTITRYTDENTKSLKNKIKTQNKLIIVLGIETIFVIIVLIIVLISKVKKKKKIKKELKDLENKENIEEKPDEIIEESVLEEQKENESNKETEILEENSENQNNEINIPEEPNIKKVKKRKTTKTKKPKK